MLQASKTLLYETFSSTDEATCPSRMPLHFKTSRFFDLHSSTGLTDWDMHAEMKLATTTDQFFQDGNMNDQYLVQWHYARTAGRNEEYVFCGEKSDEGGKESLVQPNLWLMVNPNQVCPIQYVKDIPVKRSKPRPVKTNPVHGELSKSAPASPSQAKSMSCENSPGGCTLGGPDAVSCVEVPECRKARGGRKKTVIAEDSKLGSWLRPPINYCILIAIALSVSRTGSLNVQQIYNFTREHFPFFQTAPDGWKNTIRHNLCFSNCFRKTPHQQCRENKRRSCLWHLTLDGRKRLRDEIHFLTGEMFKELKKSMAYPGEMVVIHYCKEIQ